LIVCRWIVKNKYRSVSNLLPLYTRCLWLWHVIFEEYKVHEEYSEWTSSFNFQNQSTTWLCLDGPLNPSWVDTFSSVLDINKVSWIPRVRVYVSRGCNLQVNRSLSVAIWLLLYFRCWIWPMEINFSCPTTWSLSLKQMTWA